MTDELLDRGSGRLIAQRRLELRDLLPKTANLTIPLF
jgi:hypothetical protein